MEGLVHIITGDGKGKTTAAMGLALRFLGYNRKVIIVHFSKGTDSGEDFVLEKMEGVKVFKNSKNLGFWGFTSKDNMNKMFEENTNNLKYALELVEKEEFCLLVLDEACSAYENAAVDISILENLLENKPKNLELVLTGRHPAEFLTKHADYISEIKSIRHPYEEKRILAREGIEY